MTPTLMPDDPSPSDPGTVVTWTATADCSVGTAEYRFWVLSPTGVWTTPQDWSTSDTFVWTTPMVGGTYWVEVDTRTALGGGNSWEDFTSASYVLNGGTGPCSSVTISALPNTPQLPETAIEVTGVASCNGADAEYRFWVMDTLGQLTVVQDWDTDATYSWVSPATGGTYWLEVDARQVGASSWESYASMQYVLGGPCSTVTLTAQQTSPQMIGNVVTLTGEAACGTPEYRFWSYNVATQEYLLLRDWNSVAAYDWTSGPATGDYVLEVDARQTGASNWESFTTIPYTLAGSCSSVAISADPNTPSPQPTGTSVVFTGLATCDGGTPEYRFWSYNVATQEYVLLQDWSSLDTVTWNSPMTAGDYVLEVDARQTTAPDWQSFNTMPYTLFDLP